MAYYDESFGYIWHNPGRREDALSPSLAVPVGHLARTMGSDRPHVVNPYRVRVETVTDEPTCQSREWSFPTAEESEAFADSIDSLYTGLIAWPLDS